MKTLYILLLFVRFDGGQQETFSTLNECRLALARVLETDPTMPGDCYTLLLDAPPALAASPPQVAKETP